MSRRDLVIQPHEDGTVTLYVGAGEATMVWPDAVDLVKQLLTGSAVAAHWIGATPQVFESTTATILDEAHELIRMVTKSEP